MTSAATLCSNILFNGKDKQREGQMLEHHFLSNPWAVVVKTEEALGGGRTAVR